MGFIKEVHNAQAIPSPAPYQNYRFDTKKFSDFWTIKPFFIFILVNNAYDKEHKDITDKIAIIQAQINQKQGRIQSLNDFIKTIEEQPTSLDNWDDSIWNLLVEKAVVNKNASITFHFRNGQKITKM